MDCSAEDNLVRMAMGGQEGVRSLNFDLPARQLKVVQTVPADQVLAALQSLNLGASLQQTAPTPTPAAARKTLFAIPKMDCQRPAGTLLEHFW